MATTRDTIYQKIALEGDSAIKEALAALGAAGEKTFSAIAAAAAKAGAGGSFAQLQNSIAAAKGKFSELGAAVGTLSPQFNALGNSMNSTGNAFKTVELRLGLLKLAADAALAAFGELVHSSAETADEAGKQAQKLGLTVEEYSRLKFAANQVGVSTEELSTGLNTLDKNLLKMKAGSDTATLSLKGLKGATGDAATQLDELHKLWHEKGQFDMASPELDQMLFLETGVQTFHGIEDLRAHLNSYNKTASATVAEIKTTSDAFKDLGVKVFDTSGHLRPTVDILLDLAAAAQKLPDSAKKTADFDAILGKTGSTLLPIFDSGRQALQAFFDEADKTKQTITPLEAVVGAQLVEAFKTAGAAVGGLKDKIALAFAPAWTAAAEAFAKIIEDNSDAIIAWAKALGDQAVPLVKDLINAFTGNDAEVVNKRVLEWRDGIAEFGKAIVVVVEGIAGLFSFFAGGPLQVVANLLNSIFGTKLTGAILVALGIVIQFLGGFRLLGNLLRTVWDAGKLVIAFFSKWEVISTAVGAALTAIGGVLTSFGGVILDVVAAGAEFIAGIISWPVLIAAALIAAAVGIFFFRDQLIAAAKQAFAGIVAEGLKLEALLAPVWAAIVSDAQAIWSSIVGAASSAWSALVASATAAWANIVAGATALPGQLASIFASIGTAIGDAITGAFNAAIGQILSIAADVAARVQGIIAGINAALGQAQSAGNGGGGFAGGGLIRGPGSGTSDSIRARLSNGEFVVRAAAVKRYGIELLYAINNLRAPARRFMDGSFGFDVGGFVGNLSNALGAGMAPPQLALAGAGPSLAAPQRSRTPITVVLPSGERLNFESDDATAAKLQRFGTRKSTSQAGRRPGWQR